MYCFSSHVPLITPLINLQLLDMIIRCILFLILIFSNADAVSFSISHFDPGVSNILYEGDAIPSNGAIELINLVHYTCRVGRATYAERVPLWDPSTGTLTDFTTQFSFTIDILNADPNAYGHGIGFFLAPVGYQIPPNSDNAFLGLVNTTAKEAMSHMPVVFVEFDTYVNEWDPPMQHVGINNNSIHSAVTATWDAGSYSGEIANVMITYNATTKYLSVLWSYDPVFRSNSSLSYQIDLMQVLPPWISVGFSAATGQFIERNTIISWEFTSSLVSVAVPEDQVHTKKPRLKTHWIVIIVGCSLLTLGVVVCLIVRKKVKGQGKNTYAGASITTNLERGALPKRFSYEDLANATKGFADERKLGQGGSGLVYKGVLSDLGCLIAVKKLDVAQSQDLFLNEVDILSSLRHRNLVQFLGWCHEQGKFLLVYEYMPNGSLHDHLFGNRKTLPWNVRYNIALGVASGLQYLHHGAEQCVVHRDIKPDNILLRTDFIAKLGDFGIAKLVDSELKTQRTTPAGTRGYVAPEYRRDGRASKHSDMYGFGVVALEIACGRRNYRNDDILYLMKEVWRLYKAGKILDAADERLKKEFDSKEMECLMTVGLWCTHPVDNERPSAERVIQFLNFQATLPDLPPMMHDPEFPYNSEITGRNTR